MSSGPELRPGAVAALGVVLLACCWGVPASAAVAGEWDEERYFLERAYRQALLDWAGGGTAADASVARYSDAQETAAELVTGQELDLDSVEIHMLPGGGREIRGQPDREIRCVLRVEENTLDLLERRSPDHLLTAAIFHLEVHIDQMTRHPRPWLEHLNRKRMEELLERYAGIAGRDFTGRERVERLRRIYDTWMLAGTAQVALGWSLPMERGVEAFDRALEIDPSALTPRYWTALVYEKLDQYSLAADALRSLAGEYPNSAEIQLRHARILRRLGQEAASRDAYRALSSRPGPRRPRILAHQELASLLAERDEGWEEAVAVLRRGVEEFPENRRLRIELSFLLADRAFRGDLPADRAADLLAESEKLAEHILDDAELVSEEPDEAGGELRLALAFRGTPRLRYELPDPALVGPEMEQAAAAVVQWKKTLHEAVQTLAPSALAEPRCLERWQRSRRRNRLGDGP